MMETRPQKTTRGTNWVLGSLLIVMGIVFLLNQIFPGFFGALIWSGVFAIAGGGLFALYTRNRSQWWLLIPSYVMFFVAAMIQIGSIRWLPDEFIGAFVMTAIGFPFLYVYLKDNKNWWALIPAYVMGTIGVLILLTTVITKGELIASYVMFSIAAPFLYVYLRDRDNWWALIPGGIMSAIGIGLLVAGLAYLIPALMIMGGIYLLARQLGKQRTTREASAEPERPATGPEADRPQPEFEPIGERASGPEADHA